MQYILYIVSVDGFIENSIIKTTTKTLIFSSSLLFIKRWLNLRWVACSFWYTRYIHYIWYINSFSYWIIERTIKPRQVYQLNLCCKTLNQYLVTLFLFAFPFYFFYSFHVFLMLIFHFRRSGKEGLRIIIHPFSIPNHLINNHAVVWFTVYCKHRNDIK